MVHIPHELQVEIFRRVGRSGFRLLGPAIAASKQTKDAVFSTKVLKAADLSDFIMDPAMAKTDSVYRSFFTACVENGNVIGTHVEGLRILCQEGPSESAFEMLQFTLPNSIFATFVSGVFRICAGDFERGMGILDHIWEIVDSWQDAVSIADMVVQQIVRLGPAGIGMYTNTYNYPIEEVPHCSYIHCAADNVCQNCFGFWYSLIIKSIC